MNLKDRINKLLGRKPVASYEIDGVNVDVYKNGEKFTLTNAKGDTFKAHYETLETQERERIYDTGPDGYGWMSTTDYRVTNKYSTYITLYKGGDYVSTTPPQGYSKKDIEQLENIVEQAHHKFLHDEKDKSASNTKIAKRRGGRDDR